MMKARVGLPLLALFAAPAMADIYTWVDANGSTHVSNLTPPDGAKTVRVTRSAPADPAREAAAREAARMAEMRAMDERMRELAMELDRSRREPPPPVIVVAPPPQAYAPPPVPYVVNVIPPQPGGCDYGWGECGFGLWPGSFPVVYPFVPVNTWFGGAKGKHPRRDGPRAHPQNTIRQAFPPLIPLPHAAGRGPRRG